jgi:hypothetical protein
MIAGFQNMEPRPAPPAAAPANDDPCPCALCSRIAKPPACADAMAMPLATAENKIVWIIRPMLSPHDLRARRFDNQSGQSLTLRKAGTKRLFYRAIADNQIFNCTDVPDFANRKTQPGNTIFQNSSNSPTPQLTNWPLIRH